MDCINKSHPKWKELIAKYDEFTAIEKFIEYVDRQKLKETNKIKPGVQELFESNPELAIQIYEALGFTKNVSLEPNLKNTGKTEQELIEYLKKKYPEIKLNITNNPVWEQGDNIFNQETENQINSFKLFEDQDELCPNGVCNYTARKSTQHLQKIGLNPYPSNYNGSQLPVKVKSPIGDFNIEHYVSAVAINNVIYIYDMPQNEFISNEFFGKGSDVKVKESYKPRLIPLTIDQIKSNYNLSTTESGNFIHSIISNNGWMGADAAPSFKDYIRKNIKNPEEYINLLESQIKDSGYEFKEWDVEEYRKDVRDKKQSKKTSKLTTEEEKKLINYYENKIKLKTKEYLPKKTDSFSLKTLINSVLGRGFENKIDYNSFETALQSLDKYLESENFIEDLLNKITIAEKNLDSINKSIEQVYSLARLFASFTKQVKVYGIEEALKKYDSKQQYTIRTLLPSNVLDKYKSKEQAAFLLQKYWGNKDNIVKQLDIFKTKTFTDLVTNKFKTYSVFNKYQTVLNFLKSSDFDSSYLYQAISNEAIRRYAYFDKVGNTQFQRDEFSRIIGQANIKAMTVLVDAVNKKQDTIPHEYAHHYIAWFRDTLIVQEGIKRFGSEEALVQAIGEQVVKQKGEAYNWWKNFVKWIMNKFNSLSKLQKEELTQILTDAFLTRQNLSKSTEDNKDAKYQQIEKSFKSNSEIGNQVSDDLELDVSNIELKPYATDVWGKVPQQRGDNSFVTKEQYSIKLGEDKGIDVRITIYFNDADKTAYVSNIENFENDRIHPLKKGLGLKGFLKANQLIVNRGYTPVVDNLVSGYGYDMLSKLEKSGYLTKVLDKKAVNSQYDSVKYEKPPFIFTNKIYKSGLAKQQKQQIEELFNSNPELDQVGTPQQYSQYLDTIFPDSKVKDIVYHFSNVKIDKPNKEKFSLSANINRRKGFFGISKNINPGNNFANVEGTIPHAMLFDMKNPDFGDFSILPPVVAKDETKDSAIIKQRGDINYYSVFEPEQIHILGSKKDIEGFKEFINKSKIESVGQKGATYVGGFSEEGKGTFEGDGKDKQMRKDSIGFIGELNSNKEDRFESSTYGSFKHFSNENTIEEERYLQSLPTEIKQGDKIMLALNGSINDKDILNKTKEKISELNEQGVTFLMGDMPHSDIRLGDSNFLNYIRSIKGKYVVYGNGNKSRIDSLKPNELEDITQEEWDNLTEQERNKIMECL